jgi:hypothetical protein
MTIGDTAMPSRPGIDPVLPAEPRPTAADLWPDWTLGHVSAQVTVLGQQSLEIGIPNITRIYDALLGGKDHYVADRKAAAEVASWRPQVIAGAALGFPPGIACMTGPAALVLPSLAGRS